MFKDPKEGYTFYTFHILLENLDKEEIFIFDSEISCIVDGVVQNNVTWFDDIDSHINKVIEPNTKVQGNFTFEVPKDTKTFDLKYYNDNWNVAKMEYPYGNGINISMSVENVENLYRILKDKQVKFFLDLEIHEYRVENKVCKDKEFLIQDPDGYLLRFNN